jgi:uncharacterized protein (DUF1501 family)
MNAITRRRFLEGAGTLTAIGFLPGLSLARPDTSGRLVLVILRGGMDGLAAVPPYGEPTYERTRAGLALEEPGRAGGILKLDGTFGLHPGLERLHRLYQAGEALVLHAMATPYRERSHFDGQDILENGTDTPHASSGWLNRALDTLPARDRPDTSAHGMALAQSVPMVLRGDAPVESWAPSPLPEVDADTLGRLAELYADEPFFAARLQRALATDDMADRAMGGGRHRGRRGRRGQFASLARPAATFLRAPDGPRVAVMEVGGWDTHANQGARQGRLATQLTALDAGIEALRQGLGPAWSQTAVIVVSEFGRTVAENGTRGTDHGTAGVGFLIGGAVRGGRILCDWPGIRRSALYEGRDLMPTLDARSLFKTVLRDHLGVPIGPLERDVFPNSAKAVPIEGLIRAPASGGRIA